MAVTSSLPTLFFRAGSLVLPLVLSGALGLSLLPVQAVAQESEARPLRAEPDARVAGIATVQQTVQVAEPGLSVESGSMSVSSARMSDVLKPNAAPPAPRPQTVFPTAAVGTTSSSTIAFSTSFTASTTVTGSGVYTQGATGLDFKDVGTGTCDTNGYPYTYAASTSCTSIISFTPSKAGNREGAEVLYTSTAGSYYYGYVTGIGTGPEVTFALATPPVSTIASGLSAYNSALDGAGDLWVTNSTAGTVEEFVATNGVYPSSPTNTYTGFTTPQGVVVDGIGNVYVGDGTKGYVWRLPATNGVVPPGTAPAAYVSFLTAGTQPIYVALDPTETDLYFIGIYSGSKYLIDCVITTGSCALDTTFTAPSGLTIDNAGYKYILDSSAKAVYRLAAATTSTAKTTVVSAGLTLPGGISTDAAGNLYIADQGAGTSGAGTVTEYIAASGLVSTTSVTRTLATGLYAPSGVTVDSLGNLFISDTSNMAVKKIDLTDAPSLSFPDTALGGTTASQTVTLQNIGNANLTFPIPTSGGNPSVPNGFVLSNSSTCPELTPTAGAAGTLAEDATCTYLPQYQPVLSGAEVGFLNVTDNALNVTSTQIVKLTGSTGGLSVEAISQNTAQGTASITLTFSVGWGGNTAPTGTPTLTVGGSSTGVTGLSCNSKLGHSACSATYATAALAGGTYPIVATQPADGTYAATSGTGILTIVNSSLKAPVPPHLTPVKMTTRF